MILVLVPRTGVGAQGVIMTTIQVRLLGRFSAQRDGQDLPGLRAKKLQELFCYLLLQRNHAHPRETLAGQLWGGVPTAESKKHLRQALWQLNAALDLPNEVDVGSILLVESESVQINPQADLWLDVADMERSFSRTRDVPGRKLDPLQVQILSEAVDLYRGDLLEGWYQDWCLSERDRIRSMYLVMLDKLMCACEERGEYERGLLLGAQILRNDPARERTHRMMMHLYWLLGDRTSALRQYDRCVASLRQDLAVRPASSTIGLYLRIRQGAVDAFITRRDMLEHLRDLLATLDLAQQQLQHEIHLLEGWSESNGLNGNGLEKDHRSAA